MKYTKSFILTLALTIGFVWPGCDPIDCNCPDIDGQYFDIQGMAAENCCSNDVLPWQDYRLFLNFEVDYFGEATPIEDSNFNPFSLMPSAWACSCIFNGIDGSMEKLANVTMITKQDFNSNYLANDTITNLFLIETRESTETMDLLTYLETDTSFIRFENLIFNLKEGPDTTKAFQMDVILELENGEVYEVTTDEIMIE